jgi:excisionase family DNA binding protein
MRKKKETTTTAAVPKVVLSTREAAAYLSISLPTLFRLTRGGELAHLRIGRVIRYRVEDLEDFLASRTTTEWKDFIPERKKAAAAAMNTEKTKEEGRR